MEWEVSHKNLQSVELGTLMFSKRLEYHIVIAMCCISFTSNTVTYIEHAVKTITKQHYADSSQGITSQVGNIETTSGAHSSRCIGRERCVEIDGYKCNADLYSMLPRERKSMN